MSDGEVQKVISELDAALEILRRHRDPAADASELKIGTMIAELRHDLAVYRAVTLIKSTRN